MFVGCTEAYKVDLALVEGSQFYFSTTAESLKHYFFGMNNEFSEYFRASLNILKTVKIKSKPLAVIKILFGRSQSRY